MFCLKAGSREPKGTRCAAGSGPGPCLWTCTEQGCVQRQVAVSGRLGQRPCPRTWAPALTRSRASGSNRSPHTWLAWKNIGRVAEQLEGLKKQEFLLLCLEPEASPLVGLQAGTLNYRANEAVVYLVHKYVREHSASVLSWGEKTAVPVPTADSR